MREKTSAKKILKTILIKALGIGLLSWVIYIAAGHLIFDGLNVRDELRSGNPIPGYVTDVGNASAFRSGNGVASATFTAYEKTESRKVRTLSVDSREPEPQEGVYLPESKYFLTNSGIEVWEDGSKITQYVIWSSVALLIIGVPFLFWEALVKRWP